MNIYRRSLERDNKLKIVERNFYSGQAGQLRYLLYYSRFTNPIETLEIGHSYLNECLRKEGSNLKFLTDLICQQSYLSSVFINNKGVNKTNFVLQLPKQTIIISISMRINLDILCELVFYSSHALCSLIVMIR